MGIAIISSTKDKASVNIKENLINNFSFNESEEQFDNNNIYEFAKNKNNAINNKNIKLYTINSELIFTDNLDKKINAGIFVFISKHRAQEDRASLTCHAIGNFGKAEHGGKDNALCYSDPILLKKLFIELNTNAEEPYEATLEATHHGPYMEKPVLFVELGSNEKCWGDKNGGFLVAKSLMGALDKFLGFASIDNDYNEKNYNNYKITGNNNDNSINKNNSNTLKNNKINNDYNNKNSIEINENKNNINNNESKIDNNGKNKNKLMNKNDNYESAFVVGGSHYNHVANKAMLQSNLAVGHICAKYNLESLDKDLLSQSMEKCNAKFVLLDWKGLGRDKKRSIDLLDKNSIEYKRSDKVF